MKISLLVAVDQEGGMGYRGDLPWHLPADLQHFKRLTMGHHVIMGRKTYQSIGRPLPGRTMIVLTRSPEFEAEGCLIAHSLQEGLAVAESRGEEQVFVIGGASVFEEAFPLADDLYLTLVHAVVEADTYLPEFDAGQWRIESERFHPADEDNPHPQTFFHLSRISDEE